VHPIDKSRLSTLWSRLAGRLLSRSQIAQAIVRHCDLALRYRPTQSNNEQLRSAQLGRSHLSRPQQYLHAGFGIYGANRVNIWIRLESLELISPDRINAQDKGAMKPRCAFSKSCLLLKGNSWSTAALAFLFTEHHLKADISETLIFIAKRSAASIRNGKCLAIIGYWLIQRLTVTQPIQRPWLLNDHVKVHIDAEPMGNRGDFHKGWMSRGDLLSRSWIGIQEREVPTVVEDHAGAWEVEMGGRAYSIPECEWPAGSDIRSPRDE
jgi:hypothetical protein